jgi:hypothetical protein
MKFSKSLLIAFSLLLIISISVSANATSKILSTNYTLVNLGTTEASVQAIYYKADGSVWDADNANEVFNIPGNYGQKIIAQYFDSTLTSGQGSVVLSSTQPLGAVAQILARNQVPTSGAYMGVIEPANVFYAPQVFRSLMTASGVANSQIIIQNTETTDIVVSVSFIPFPGVAGLSPYTKPSITIKPGASFVYDLSNESNLSSGWTGSAVITSGVGTDIAVLANTFIGLNSLQTYNAFPATKVSSSWAIPQFVSKLSNGLNTVALVQNLSGTVIAINDLTLSCVAATGFTPATFSVKNPTTVPANAIYAFNPFGSSNAIFPPNWSGTCDITSSSSKDLVVLVQMRKPGFSEELAAYEAIPGNSTDTLVVIPLISKNQANGFATAATIKNLDKVNLAEVTLIYTPSTAYVSGGGSATVITFDATIPAGGNLIQSQRFTGTPQLPNGWYGSLLVKPKLGSTPRPLGALVQLTNIYPQAGDTFMTHMAFTQP